MNTNLVIRFKLLYPDSKPPIRAISGDAGWDLSLHSHEELIQNGTIIFKTGVAVEIPPGHFGLLRPRSSICKTGYGFASSGIIDSGYRGEIGIPMRWFGGNMYGIGDRIAQLIILPLPDVAFVQVNELSESVRGEGGFGSSGKQ